MWLCVSLTECLALHWNWLLMGQVVQSTQKQNSRDIWLTVKSNDIVFCLAFPQICEDRITFFKSLLVEIWRWTFLGEWDSERHFGESQGDPRVVPTLQSEIWAHSPSEMLHVQNSLCQLSPLSNCGLVAGSQMMFTTLSPSMSGTDQVSGLKVYMGHPDFRGFSVLLYVTTSSQLKSLCFYLISIIRWFDFSFSFKVGKGIQTYNLWRNM